MSDNSAHNLYDIIYPGHDGGKLKGEGDKFGLALGHGLERPAAELGDVGREDGSKIGVGAWRSAAAEELS